MSAPVPEQRLLLAAGHATQWAACLGWTEHRDRSRPVRACRDAHRWPCCDRPSLGCCPGPQITVGGRHHATSPDRSSCPPPPPPSRIAQLRRRPTAECPSLLACDGLAAPTMMGSEAERHPPGGSPRLPATAFEAAAWSAKERNDLFACSRYRRCSSGNRWRVGMPGGRRDPRHTVWPPPGRPASSRWRVVGARRTR